jgi:hypothetical protein
MADTDECASCGAPGLAPGAAECEFCGAAAPTAAPVSGPGPEAQEPVPPDLPPAKEARRIRGLAVPVVAGLVVVGIGYPLTALAVTKVGQQQAPSGEGAAGASGDGPRGGPSAPAAATGRARLGGAVIYDGPVMPLSCSPTMRLGTFQAPAGRFSILVSVPAGAESGTFPLRASTDSFVVVAQLTSQSPTWTSLAQTASAGQATVRADRSVTAEFSALQPGGGGAKGTVDGNVELRCA